MGATTVDSGNIFVKNLGLNPAINFNFMLRVEGIMDLPCRSVHVFQKENEYELIQEGGLNDYVHMRRKPISKPFTFQVERYVGVDILDPLSIGTDLVLPVILFVNRYAVYGDFYPIRMYVFTGCTVMGKEYGELNGEKSGLLVETTTLAYRELFCITNPLASFLVEKPWKFVGTNKAGSGKQYAKRDTDEPSKSDMIKKASKWMFADGNTEKALLEEKKEAAPERTDDKKFLGVNQHATENPYSKAELRKSDMQKKARKWPGNASARKNTGETSKEKMMDRASKWMFADGDTEKALLKAQNKEAPEDRKASEVFLGVNPRATLNAFTKKEVRKADMLTKARKWPDKNSAVTNSEESTKKEMEKSAYKWMFAGGDTEKATLQPDDQTELPEREAEKVFLGVNPRATKNPYSEKEIRKADMKTKARVWPDSSSAVLNKEETDKDTMEESARQWPPTKSAVYNEKESTKEFMEKNASKWMFAGGDTAKAAKKDEEAEDGQSQGQDSSQSEEAAATPEFLGLNSRATKNPYSEQEVRKAAMITKARKWPQTRSAVDVARFLTGISLDDAEDEASAT